ncbi:MAG: hypothetical protein WAM66_05765 [Acidobacteriaceae bacterium]
MEKGDANVLLWVRMFTLPIAVLVAILVYLFQKNRPELRRITAWATITSGFASPAIGLWGEVHIDKLWARSALDYGFETDALFVSVVAALLAFIWFVRSRRWYSIAVFAVSSLMFVIWLMICATL